MGIYDNEKRMWFGTEERMGWIETPLSGADVSPAGWSADATMLNGGGFALNSWASHKRFSFGWGESATRQLASTLHSYADGSFGRGLLYFLDPMWYEINVLPKHWADPSMALNAEAPPLIYDVDPSSTPTSPNSNNLPVQTAIYTPPTAGFNQADSLFIPIPEGHYLHLGAVYTRTGTGGVFYSPVSLTGATGAAVLLPQTAPNAATLNATVIPQSGLKGIRLWIGKTSGAASTVSITGMVARISSPSDAIGGMLERNWLGGQGHTGCRFVGKPTLVNYNGVLGGQVGVGATFAEVGGWLD